MPAPSPYEYTPAEPEPVPVPSEAAPAEPESTPAEPAPEALPAEPAPVPCTIDNSRCPGDGKGELQNWNEAASYLHALITKHVAGLDYTLDVEGNTCCLGRLEDNWQKMCAAPRAQELHNIAGALFGIHRAEPLLTFLLKHAQGELPKEPYEWYYRTQRAFCFGSIDDAERDRQSALVRPWLTDAVLEKNGGFRYLRMCAAGGDTELISTLLQLGVDPVHPGLHSGDTDTRAEMAHIPTLLREELRQACALPVAAAAYCGHTESVRLLMQHATYEPHLNQLLAYACLSRNEASFADIEQILLSHGARHSELSLACAVTARNDETIMRILKGLESPQKKDLTRALLIMIGHGVGQQCGNRCRIAELLVEAGADVHALESKPAGMPVHPLYLLFSSCGEEAIQLYSTLAGLGMNEKKVLSLDMNDDGEHLLACCDAAQRSFLNWNVTPRIIIDAAAQRLTIEGGVQSFSAAISTGLAGLGNENGSGRTPVGRFSIYSRHGEDAPLMTMFRMRRPVGQWPQAALPGEDGILSRILTLEGEERDNANSRARNIYIHGTPDVENLGKPASHGCIRLSPEDMVELFELAYPGMEVIILPDRRATSH